MKVPTTIILTINGKPVTKEEAIRHINNKLKKARSERGVNSAKDSALCI